MQRLANLSQALLTLTVGLTIAVTAVTVQAQDFGREPPSVSRAETLQLFRAQRYDQAFRHALHRYQWGDEALHYPLAYMYQQGKGTGSNYRLARQHYTAAAQQGHVEAMYQLGNMARFGEGGSSDRRQACHWYKQAAERDHLDANYQLAQCHLNGHARGSDPELGLSLLHRNALRLDEKALRSLHMHYAKEGTARRTRRAVYKTSERQAMAGQAQAARRSATQAIQQGDYRGYASLADALRQSGAASASLIAQMYALGEMFGSPLAVYNVGQRLLQQNKPGAACKQFEIAFHHDLPQAGIQVAECYRAGDLASRKPEYDACKTYERASTQGSAQAAMRWARCLASDLFKPLDQAAAMLAYTRAMLEAPQLGDGQFAVSLCGDAPTKLIARDAKLSLFNAQTRPLPAFANACVVSTEQADSSQVFVTELGLFGTINNTQLLPMVEVDGFALARLTRDMVREQLFRNEKYRALSLSDQRDELKVNFLQDTDLVITYDADGNATSLTRIINTVSDKARFHGRVAWLSSALERQPDQSSDKNFLSARWTMPAWDVLLMQDVGKQQIRERYSFTNE